MYLLNGESMGFFRLCGCWRSKCVYSIITTVYHAMVVNEMSSSATIDWLPFDS